MPHQIAGEYKAALFGAEAGPVQGVGLALSRRSPKLIATSCL